MKDGKYLTDSVPFSYCDPRVRRPCVHHSMLNSFQHTKYDSSNVTVYEIGCTRAMANHYAATIAGLLKLLFAALVVELALTVTFRYLQTSTGAAIEEEDMDMDTRGYLWTVSKKTSKEKKPAPTAAGGKASPSKGGKSPAAIKGAGKKGAAKSEKDKSRNNVRPNNNNIVSQTNYNNMLVDQISQHAQPRTGTLPTSDRNGGRTTRQAPVTRMPSSATASASRQTSATYVGGSSRQTSGTHLTASSLHDTDASQRTKETRSVSRQQSHNSVATRSSASTSGLQRSAAGSSSYASAIRSVTNMSRNNNVNAAPESLSSSAFGQCELQVDSTSVCPADIRYVYEQQQPQQQQHQQLVVFDADVGPQQPSPAALHAHHNFVEPIQRPEVPRPLTPIPIPEVHRATTASARLPRSIPLADYLASPRSSRGPTGSTNGNRQMIGHVMHNDRARGTGSNNAAVQTPLASVHKPVGGPLVASAHAPSNYPIVPTMQQSSTVTPPPLPPRNASTTEDSPYVMMYPLRPPRNHLTMTRPRTE